MVKHGLEDKRQNQKNRTKTSCYCVYDANQKCKTKFKSKIKPWTKNPGSKCGTGRRRRPKGYIEEASEIVAKRTDVHRRFSNSPEERDKGEFMATTLTPGKY